MKPNPITLALLSAAFLAFPPALTAQDAPAKPEPKTSKASPSLDELIEQLGAERATERRAAESALAEMGEAARKSLEAAAEDGEDPEVRWRARRLLRGLDGGAPRLERRSGSGTEKDGARGQGQDDGGGKASGNAEGDETTRAMLKRMQDSFGPGFQGLPEFGELQRQMEDLQRQMEEFQSRAFGGRVQALPFGNLRSLSSGTKVEIGPDRVRVEVEEPKGDGGHETKTYEAPDMDSFRDKYPEIAQRYFPDGARGLLFGGGHEPVTPRLFGGRFQPQRMPGFGAPDPVVVPQSAEAAPPADGEKLGVYVGVLDDSVRRFLDIEEGLGILVDRVEDGTLATALGIQPKDVILRIAGAPIRETADVRRALRGIQKGDGVEVEVNRHGQTRSLSAPKDADAPAPRKLGKLRSKDTPAEVEPETKDAKGR